MPTDATETGRAVESRVIEVLGQVKGSVGIPVAVKLSPYYSSLPNLAAELEFAGADGLVLVPYLEGERTPNLPRATGAVTCAIRLPCWWFSRRRTSSRTARRTSSGSEVTWRPPSTT